jgi:malic enzyme
MGFNRRKMEDQRRQASDEEAAARRATDAHVLEDTERLIGAWNERQAKRMPMIFSPTIGAAIACIGTCGYAARPVAPFKLSTYAQSTGIAMRP